jgi:hypothetical protein
VEHVPALHVAQPAGQAGDVSGLHRITLRDPFGRYPGLADLHQSQR